jgi:pantetheine-phosphate adenylyltransferase
VSSQLEDPASPAPSPITTIDGSSYTAAAQAAVGTCATVCLGGTFDHLHAGHKVLLTVAGLWAHTRVYCGVTTPALLAKKAHVGVMQSYDERAMAVTRLLSIVRRSVGAEIVAIDDGFGPTITLPDLEALTVSEETRAGADAINAERARRGYKPLAIHAVSLVVPEGRAAVNKLSSTLIRSYIAGGMKDVSLFGLNDPEVV